MSDPYDDDPYATVVSPRVAQLAPAPIDEEKAQGYLRQYDEKAKKHGATYEDIMKKRADAIATIQNTLDGTISEMRAKRSGEGPWQANMPLLALGSGLLQGSPPGTAGSFAQDLGVGAHRMGEAISRQRMGDSDFLKGVADLQMKSGALGDIPLRDAQTSEQRKEIQAETNKARLEAAMIRAGAAGKAGQDPSLVKEWKIWSAPGTANEGKPFEEYLEAKARFGADRNTPANLRELDAVNKERKDKGHAPLSLDEWIAQKASSGASGKEKGKVGAEAEIALPSTMADLDNVQTTVNRIAEHPGQKRAFGAMSLVPNYPGGEVEDFNQLREQLGSQAFLTQVKKMAGLGALSEAEGNKLAAAAINLSKTQSRKQFNENLELFKQQIARTREIAKQRAGKTPDVVSPKVGEVREGWTFKGGDAGDPQNWRK